MVIRMVIIIRCEGGSGWASCMVGASGALAELLNVGSYVIGHYAKHKTLKGMNYKRLGKDFLWGLPGVG